MAAKCQISQIGEGRRDSLAVQAEGEKSVAPQAAGTIGGALVKKFHLLHDDVVPLLLATWVSGIAGCRSTTSFAHQVSPHFTAEGRSGGRERSRSGGRIRFLVLGDDNEELINETLRVNRFHKGFLDPLQGAKALVDEPTLEQSICSCGMTRSQTRGTVVLAASAVLGIAAKLVAEQRCQVIPSPLPSQRDAALEEREVVRLGEQVCRTKPQRRPRQRLALPNTINRIAKPCSHQLAAGLAVSADAVAIAPACRQRVNRG